MSDIGEKLKNSALEVESWQEGENVLQLFRLTPSLALVEMRQLIPPSAAPLLSDTLSRFVATGTTIVGWDIFELDSYSKEVRSQIISFLGGHRREIQEFHVGATNPSWTIKAEINLGSLLMRGRVKLHTTREVFYEEIQEIWKRTSIE